MDREMDTNDFTLQSRQQAFAHHGFVIEDVS